MHRAAQPTIEACGTRKNFGKRSVNKETTCEFFSGSVEILFHNCQYRAIKKRLHNIGEFLVAQFVDSRHTFGQNFAVRAVAAEDKILNAKCPGHTNCCRFLPDRQVSRTGVIVRSSVVFTLGFNEVQHGFELANQRHIVINGFEFIVGKKPFFVFYRFLVLIYGNWLKFHKTGFPCF